MDDDAREECFEVPGALFDGEVVPLCNHIACYVTRSNLHNLSGYVMACDIEGHHKEVTGITPLLTRDDSSSVVIGGQVYESGFEKFNPRVEGC